MVVQFIIIDQALYVRCKLFIRIGNRLKNSIKGSLR